MPSLPALSILETNRYGGEGHGKRESGEGSLLARHTPGGGGGRGTTGCLDWEQPVPSRIGRMPWFPEGWPRFHITFPPCPWD